MLHMAKTNLILITVEENNIIAYVIAKPHPWGSVTEAGL